jgi:hypothetical protein
MSLLYPFAMKGTSGLADETDPSTLSRYTVCERHVIRGREVARIDESDLVRIQHNVHWCPLVSTREPDDIREAQGYREDIGIRNPFH